MNKKPPILIIFVVFIVAGMLIFLKKEPYQEEMTDTQTQEVTAEPEKTNDANSKEEIREEVLLNQEDGDETPGEYVDYTEETFNQAIKNRKVVLFFHAAWCPTCKVADKRFEQNTDQIPNDVTVFKVDYDKESELKKEYGITYQHTFVQLDEEGAVVTRWAGGDIQELNDNLN